MVALCEYGRACAKRPLPPPPAPQPVQRQRRNGLASGFASVYRRVLFREYYARIPISYSHASFYFGGSSSLAPSSLWIELPAQWIDVESFDFPRQVSFTFEFLVLHRLSAVFKRSSHDSASLRNFFNSFPGRSNDASLNYYLILVHSIRGAIFSKQITLIRCSINVRGYIAPS